MSLRQAIYEVLQPKKVEEATDVFNKFGIQITRTALKGGLGFQINYGERGRYIQVLKKDMNNLIKAMQTAMKAKQEILMKDFFELRSSMNEDAAYHKEMKRAHDTHSYAHENEVTNDGHPDHDYAGNEHGEAANHHQKAMDAHKKHGGDSPQYKKAAAAAHKQTTMAHMATKDAGKFKQTAKPGIKFPKKP